MFSSVLFCLFYTFASIIKRLAFDKYNCQLSIINLSINMSCILNIETSTSVCSVALSAGGEVLFEKSSFEGPSHAALLGVYAEEAIAVVKAKGLKLEAVASAAVPVHIPDCVSAYRLPKDYVSDTVSR